jgi:hypothetical protein
MGIHHKIVLPESSTNAYGNRLLPDTGVNISADQGMLKQFNRFFLKTPNCHHLFVHVKAHLTIYFWYHFSHLTFLFPFPSIFLNEKERRVFNYFPDAV